MKTLNCLALVIAFGAPFAATAQPPEYCHGFSFEACTRMQMVATSGIRPAECTAGYGRVDRGLTREQVRTCGAFYSTQAELGHCDDVCMKEEPEDAAEIAAYHARKAEEAAAIKAAQEKEAVNHDWRKIEADNGQIFAVDMKSLRHAGKAVDVIVYAMEGPNDGWAPGREQRYRFYCEGHYAVEAGDVRYAPPRSVAGAISALVCSQPHTVEPSPARGSAFGWSMEAQRYRDNPQVDPPR